jgi:hypothetical protein
MRIVYRISGRPRVVKACVLSMICGHGVLFNSVATPTQLEESTRQVSTFCGNRSVEAGHSLARVATGTMKPF